MKNYPLQHLGAIALAIVGGTVLGYVQDNITASLLWLPFLSILLIVGMIGWAVCVVWYGMALRIAWLRRLGLQHTSRRLVLLLLWLVFTVIGGVAFFSLNEGIVTMPFVVTILISAGMGMSYNFFLVVLPSLIFWKVRPSSPQPRSPGSSARRRASRHE
ncbi:MAG: hypothetical protein JXB07_10800 [Anaerolineae bacterium]|nr:hypothetical protein [Anaerolineae bacterium]